MASDYAKALGAKLRAIRQQQGRTGEMLDFLIDVARDNPSVAADNAAPGGWFRVYVLPSHCRISAFISRG